MSPVPLDLFAEVTTASGTRFKWDANQEAGSRPKNLSFRTKIGEGFSDASLQLARRIDLDYADLNLGDTVTLTAADGTVVYEGTVVAMPRDLSDTHSIGVTLAGFMAHAKDHKFQEIYVDRDMSRWGPMSVGRKAAHLNSSQTPHDPEQNIDPTDGKAGVSTVWTGATTSPYKLASEAWYDAGPGLTVKYIDYSWQKSVTVDNTDANYRWAVYASSDDKATSTSTSGSLRAAGPSVLQSFTATNATRWAYLELFFATTPGLSAGNRYAIDWYKLAAWGDTAVGHYAGEPGEPSGVVASDVIKDIARKWCPLLDVSGVQSTDYVIQHCVFRERTFPYDAWLEINKYHLWHLGVWENRRLDFRPYDLTDYDWEIRTDDEGTTFSPQGVSTGDLFNGIVVTYTDLVTGIVNVLTPDTDAELADTDPDNPWNQHGRQVWDEITLSTPTLEASALQIGRAALEDRNRPRTPGTITVRGYIRDRAGNPQPVSKVRAGDTIQIKNFNDAIRLIVETDCDDENKQIRLAIDKPFQLLDAYLDRQANALQARGLN